MSPYIVRHERVTTSEIDENVLVLPERACATSEEARALLLQHRDDPDTRREFLDRLTCFSLPDGSTIEVEQVSWVDLAYHAGMRNRVLASFGRFGDPPDKVRPQFPPYEEILAAFNAKHGGAS